MARAARPTPASSGEVEWVRLRNFMRGYSPKAVLQGEALQFADLMIDREMKAVPRPGVVAATGDLGTLCQGIMRPAPGNTTVFVYDGKVAWATGDLPWTPTVLETNTGTGTLAQIFKYGAYAIIVGCTTVSGGTPRKYTSGAVTDLGGSPPSALSAAIWGDRLWVAGSGSKRLHYSDSGNPESWPALNWMDVGDSAYSIQALVPTGDALYIVKVDSVWQLTGRTSSDFYLRCLVDKIGIQSTSNMRAFETVGGASIAIMSDQRLWAKTGDITEMSDQVAPITTGYGPSQMLWDMKNQRLLLSVATGAATGYILVFDAMRKGWYKWNIPAACFYYDPNDSTLYVGCRTGQFGYLNYSTYTDFGVAFAPVLQEQFIPIASPLLEKYLRHVYVDGICATGVGTVKAHYRMKQSGTYSTVTRTGLTFPCVLNYSWKRFSEVSIEVTVSDPTGFQYEGVDVGYIPVRRKRK